MKIYILSYRYIANRLYVYIYDFGKHRLCRLNYQKIRIKILSKHFIQHSLLILCYCGNMQERLISAGVNFCSLTTKDSIFLSLLAYRSASNLAIASWHNPEMKNCIFKCISFNYQLNDSRKRLLCINIPWSITPSTSLMISPTFNWPLWYAAPSGWMEMILGRGCCVFTPPSMTRPRKGKHFWISMTWTERLGINSPGWCCEAWN